MADIQVFNNPDFDFNPRPPCGGRQRLRAASLRLFVISTHVLHAEDDEKGLTTYRIRKISTHVLHAEDDVSNTIPIVCLRVFQPTSSMRRTTCWTSL